MKLQGSLHFLGISGSGMAPLAEACFRLGIKVTGYDSKPSDYAKSLIELKIPINQNPDFDFENPSALVVSTAIASDHPQIQLAKKRNIPILHRSDVLAALVNEHDSIAVAGTHGKTSTTAMIAHMLDHLKLRPLAVVGGNLIGHASSIIFGDGPRVVEADESDGSFLKYHPDICVVTNIEADHMDYWKNEDLLKQGFKEFLNGAKEGKPHIVGWDSPFVRDICRELTKDFLSYGFAIGSHVRAVNVSPHGTGSRFTAIVEKEKVECQILLPGRHNILNALAALAVAKVLGESLHRACEGLATFRGVARRFEPIYESERYLVFNDYAHNPGKITAACSVLSDYFPKSRKIVVFQPHRYTRVKSLWDGFSVAFKDMDLVLVTEIYSAGETPIPDVNAASLAQAIALGSGVKTLPIPKDSDIISLLAPHTDKKDVILFVGAGDVGKYIDRLLGSL